MTYKEIFYKGFDTTNKNILLALVKMAASYALIIGFVIVLIIPLIVAAAAFGTGIFTSLKDFDVYNIGSLLLSKYLALAVVLALIVLFYVVIATFVAMYVYGGVCGMIARGIRDTGFKFSMEGFFAEGKRLFGPVLGFTSIVGAAVIIILLLLAASVFPIRSILNTLADAGRPLSMFMSYFMIMAAVVILFFLFTGTLAITFYGTGIMIFKGMTAMQAANEAVRFIFKRPSAFGFFLLCMGINFFVNIMIAGSTIGVAIIPVIGAVAVFPYQILVQAVQYYLGILFIAMLFSYYFKHEGLDIAAAYKTSTAVTDTTPPLTADLNEGTHPSL
ncbi:hypothetical protein [Candidatus Magnetominusculus xianensis]|uniref:Glycerophosphoryl diester phosphodiesterase membrane domain-containing protein n=1 Tax=Candidatus Magnetominusculus xianensis TaxID=1748249 RepID=A0ABR5SLW7_9BACT|nr:hypothetical protein [Candidatus Magnetominusculus xianensis]KWT91950.1 hypothetical protein ASN18_0647 [Candidatus Magnetominusculus xianensis]MBF0403223.1 hypothetical protein [Nitrospirota bacterium]